MSEMNALVAAQMDSLLREHMNRLARQPIFSKIADERDRQDEKWGVQDSNDTEWATVLGEEFGEVCQEALRCHFGNKDAADLEIELIQVAAVAVAWIDCLRRNGRVS